MKKIKIGYFADGKWSHEAFKLLIKNKTVEILFIVPRTETNDDTLKKISQKYKIDYLEDSRINTDEFYEKMKLYNCDLFLSMSFNQIFKSRLLNLPSCKTINCHAGKLPFYRGRNILNWALINDEKEFGITVHYVDIGIDTGDIILQRTFPIDEDDNYNTLLEVAYKECAIILRDAIDMIYNNKVSALKQTDIHPVGFYCGVRGVGDEIINWNQNSRELFNFIRAICKPGPMATTSLNNKPFYINKSRLIVNAPLYKGIPGQIIAKDKGKLIIKTKDSTILIEEYEHNGKVKVGDRLK